MPLLKPEKVNHPVWQFNGHLQTIAPNLRRKVEDVLYQRERIDTWDDDFLDLDWSVKGSDTLLIATHGLAGNSNMAYIRGIIRMANDQGWDALAWNYRGCSGEPNRRLYSFHAGKTDDLAWVIQHAFQKKEYKHIYLVGVSLGGNISLKLTGEWGEHVPYPIRKVVAISAPLDMYETSLHLIKGWNRIYSRRYLKQYKEMLSLKQQMFPEAWDYAHAFASPDLHLFVERFTAPSFGFADAKEYLFSQSAMHYLEKIRIPSLLINADNDPFLTAPSFPEAFAEQSNYFYFLKSLGGGHVGFEEKNQTRYNWVEKRIMQYLTT